MRQELFPGHQHVYLDYYYLKAASAKCTSGGGAGAATLEPSYGGYGANENFVHFTNRRLRSPKNRGMEV